MNGDGRLGARWGSLAGVEGEWQGMGPRAVALHDANDL